MSVPHDVSATDLAKAARHHAPGPWHIIAGPNYGRHPDFPELEYLTIESQRCSSVTDELAVTTYMRRADAVLISEAPALLAALRSVLESDPLDLEKRDAAWLVVLRAQGHELSPMRDPDSGAPAGATVPESDDSSIANGTPGPGDSSQGASDAGGAL